MTDILALAEARAAAQAHMDYLGRLNTPMKVADRIASDARMKLAIDAYRLADKAYEKAIAGLTPDELIELSKRPLAADKDSSDEDNGRWSWEQSGVEVEVQEGAISRRRSWRERLLTRPWRPWISREPTEFGAWMDRVIASGNEPKAALHENR